MGLSFAIGLGRQIIFHLRHIFIHSTTHNFSFNQAKAPHLRGFCSVTRSDVEMVKQLRGKYLTATEAGRMLGMHRTHMLNLEKRGLVEPVRLGKNKKLRLYERSAVRDLVKQPQERFVSADKSTQKLQAVPLSKTWDGWLPLPKMEAGNGGAPRLTWESLWTGTLEGWDEAEESMRDAQVSSAAKPV